MTEQALTTQVRDQILAGRLPRPGTYVRRAVYLEGGGTSSGHHFSLADLPMTEGYAEFGGIRRSSVRFQDVTIGGITRDFVVFRETKTTGEIRLDVSLQQVINAVKQIRSLNVQQVLGMLNAGARAGWQDEEVFPNRSVGLVSFVKTTVEIAAAGADASGVSTAKVTWSHRIDHVWEWYYLQYRRLSHQYQQFMADPHLPGIARNLPNAPNERAREHSLMVLNTSGNSWVQVGLANGWNLMSAPTDPRQGNWPPGGIYANLRP